MTQVQDRSLALLTRKRKYGFVRKDLGVVEKVAEKVKMNAEEVYKRG